jgi:hypothetical protein
MGAAGSEKISAWIWVALAALVLLALAVIFVLPNVVQQYELPLTPRVSQPVVETPAATVVVPSASPAMSPFEEAQNARQRREAQDALASLLERQTDLEVTNVTAWAAQEYEAAVQKRMALKCETEAVQDSINSIGTQLNVISTVSSVRLKIDRYNLSINN